MADSNITPGCCPMHEEFVKRMEAEHDRINERLCYLETQTQRMTDIALSVKEISLSVKQVADTQAIHSKKLDLIEGRDAEKWRNVVMYAVTAVVGVIIGFIANKIGL